MGVFKPQQSLRRSRSLVGHATDGAGEPIGVPENLTSHTRRCWPEEWTTRQCSMVVGDHDILGVCRQVKHLVNEYLCDL
jgi:hypothetical protein